MATGEHDGEDHRVIIIGAGPSGLAMSACLKAKNIPHLILEKEDCYASLWFKRSYDRLKLHLGKEFCSLPYMPHSRRTPTFIPKDDFLDYLKSYVERFEISPKYNQTVQFAWFNKEDKKWKVMTKDGLTGRVEDYLCTHLVVASGENGQPNVPEIEGLESFKGEVVHSVDYKNGLGFEGKDVLVVGCGNSGMEIAFDLSNYGARTSVVVIGPFHVLTKEMVLFGMRALKYKLPATLVDFVVKTMAKFVYGDLSKYGIRRPAKGPFFIKNTTGRSAVIDVGTIDKIKSGEIKVVPAISRIEGRSVVFANGVGKEFDAIVFATGYKSLAAQWLKDYSHMLGDDGFPRKKPPNHWKGENNLYCAGFSRSGLLGVSKDAVVIADDIANNLFEYN